MKYSIINTLARALTLSMVVTVVYTGVLMVGVVTKSDMVRSMVPDVFVYADSYGYDATWDGDISYEFDSGNNYDYTDYSYDDYDDYSYDDYDYDDYSYDDYDYDDYSYDDYDYTTPSYGGSSYSFPSFSSYTPSSSGGSSRATATATATANQRQTQTQNVYNYGTSGGGSSYPVYIPVPQQVASQPINIVNNNVNTNVNTNTAPVYQPPVYNPPTTPQCAIYATASRYQGAKVTLSWATEYGDTTKIHCNGGVLGSKRVSSVDTKNIYPWSSTTCYATVTSSAGASNSCSVYISVEKPQPRYVAPVYTPTYTPPIVVQQPIYTPTYTPPVVTVTSSIIPTYVPHTVILSETPYTGFDDPIWMFTYIALITSAGYAAYAYYRALRGRKKFSVVDNY